MFMEFETGERELIGGGYGVLVGYERIVMDPTTRKMEPVKSFELEHIVASNPTDSRTAPRYDGGVAADV
jgi:hypothetical protein